MSYEFWSTAAAVGTFIVISATAVAAIIQLRHLRANNQLSAVLTLFGQRETPEMQRYFSFVRNEFGAKMQDAAFRDGLTRSPIDRTVHPEMYVCDFYDQLGDLITIGLVPERVILSQEAFRIEAFWDLLSPAIAVMRRDGGGDYYIGFEFLARKAREFIARSRARPAVRFKRMETPDPWLEVDAGRGGLQQPATRSQPH